MMPKRCAVPNCNTGRKAEPWKHSVFRVPNDIVMWKKWEEAIPGAIKLGQTQVVCDRHFDARDIFREWVKRDLNGKIIAQVQYKTPRLNKVAVPSIFCESSVEKGNDDPSHEYVKRTPSGHRVPTRENGAGPSRNRRNGVYQCDASFEAGNFAKLSMRIIGTLAREFPETRNSSCIASPALKDEPSLLPMKALNYGADKTYLLESVNLPARESPEINTVAKTAITNYENSVLMSLLMGGQSRGTEYQTRGGLRTIQIEEEPIVKEEIIVKDEPLENGEPYDKSDFDSQSDECPMSSIRSQNMKMTRLRVSLVRLEDSKNPEIIKYLNALSLRPSSSCSEIRTTTVVPEIKHESVDLVTLADPIANSRHRIRVIPLKDLLPIQEPEKKSLECDIRLESSCHESSLRTYIPLHARDRSHECVICKETFVYKSSLISHMTYHCGERKRQYECNVCSKTFSQKGSLTRHVITHYGKRPHACDICSKTFYRKSHLTDHMSVHTGERRHMCRICSKTFLLMGDINRHMFIHRGEKPYGCDICSKTFSRKGTLKRHVPSHDEKPHTCDVCMRTFPRKGSLNRHMSIHNLERRSCNICTKTFSRKGTLDEHMELHDRGLKYVCDICSEVFIRKRRLRAHISLHN